MSDLSTEFTNWFKSVNWKVSNEEELKKWKAVAAFAYYTGWKRGINDGVDGAVNTVEEMIDKVKFSLGSFTHQ